MRRKCLTRIDYPHRSMHGWFVRVAWRRRLHQKWFSDVKHGGFRESRAAAARWRDRLERALGKPRTDRLVTTGHSRRAPHVGVRWDARRQVYVVTAAVRPRVQVRRQFSARRLGRAEAKRQAIAWRETQERRAYGAPIRSAA